MQYKKTLASATLAATALAAYVPPEPWSTLTPSGTCPGGLTDYTSTFGITVEPITTMGSKAKRAAISQIGDGQIQAATVTVDTTVTTVTKNGGTVTTIVNAPTRAAISQITDGQIQAPAGNHPTAAAVSQITDGQIQATHPVSVGAVSQIHDGQAQASGTSPVPTGKPVTLTSCKSDGTLELVIKGGVLTDAKGRIGSIVSNRQFQFDGPPPQAGAIYAKGWSISPEGNLALGSSDVFYQCLSGNFYNLYDQDIGHQCSPVHLAAIDLVNC